MTELVSERWVWDEATFVQAWELGVFGDRRVELVEGEVWLVSIGDWHGDVTANVTRALPNGGEWRVTQSSLPSAGSVPDPDVWVRRADAKPVERVGSRLSRWLPDDVVLVVEVSDATVSDDTTTKARV